MDSLHLPVLVFCNTSFDVSEEKEHAIGNWRKVDPYYTVVILEGIAEMCPRVVWKAEFVND